jgi:hypothetical protein
LDLAENLKQALSKRGIQAFVADSDLPKPVAGMKRWRSSIDEAINGARTFVLILSKGELSKEVIREVGVACRRSRKDGRFFWIIGHSKGMSRTSAEILTSVRMDTAELNQIDFSSKEELARQIDTMLGDDGSVRQRSVSQPARSEDLVDPAFKESFSAELNTVTRLLRRKVRDHDLINGLIDRIITLFKERIDRWDVASVRFATSELFGKLYRYSERRAFAELYMIFQDLFLRAYHERRHLLGSMIDVISLTLFEAMLETWVRGHDIEKLEKGAKLLTRLGIDFLNRDLAITRDCATQIDNLAGDMFEPPILAKEIILTASVLEAGPHARQLAVELVDSIMINDQFAWGDNNYTYLKDSIKYARNEQSAYGMDLAVLEEGFLEPALQQNIDMQVEDYAGLLRDLVAEGETDLTVAKDDLVSTIKAYKSLRPTIADDIRKRVSQAQNSRIERMFHKIVDSDSTLRKIYDR